MVDEVTVQEAIKRSLDAYAAEKGQFYESALRPMLDEISKVIVDDLKAFGYEVVKAPKVAKAGEK